MRPSSFVVFAPLFLLVSCEFLPCPRNVTLSAADVPCDCAGAVIESVSCGDLVCGDFGVEFEKGTGTTSDCVTTSTYSESSTTPLE